MNLLKLHLSCRVTATVDVVLVSTLPVQSRRSTPDQYLTEIFNHSLVNGQFEICHNRIHLWLKRQLVKGIDHDGQGIVSTLVLFDQAENSRAQETVTHV